MGNGKLCPNCGKTVPESKAYCMNCGISLGVKCPECGVVSPLGSKICVGCGHSFEIKPVRKKSTRKNALKLFAAWLCKRANIILPILCAAVLITTVVFFFLPAFEFTATEMTGTETEKYSYNAPQAIGGFFGVQSESMSKAAQAIENNGGEPYLATLTADLLGFSYLAVMIFTAGQAIYLFGNIGTLTRAAWKKLRLPMIIGGACSALQFACAFVCGLYMQSVTSASKTTVYSFGGTATAFMIIQLVWLGVLTALLFGSVSGKEVSGDERSYTDILIRNKAIKFISSRLSKGRGKKKGDNDKPALTVTKGFSWYIALLIGSLIFTQALVNVASHILFLFLLIAPLVMLLYILFAQHALNVYMLSDSATVEKNSDYTYEFRISNNSIFAYPFIDAIISIPQYNSVRCTERCVRLSMAPMARYYMKNTVNFRFRGTYGIGVKCFYVYDFFRIFKLRVDIENVTDVYVLPRKLDMDESRANAVSDSAKRTVKSPITYDKLEVSDIRDYRLGDPLKSIHWKLSSKSEDFIVREYNTGTSKMTYVYCDLSARFPDEAPARTVEQTVETETGSDKDKKSKKNKRTKKNKKQKTALVAQPAELDVDELERPEYYEDMNEYLADGVVELAVSAVLRELRAGKPVTLVWYDSRSEAGAYCCTVTNEHDFNLIYKQFATAPLCKRSEMVGQLTAMVNDSDNAKQIFVSAAVDREAISDLCSIQGLSEGASFGSSEVLLYNPEERFAHKQERRNYIEGCRAQLAENGLTLTVGELPADTDTANPEKEAVNR